MIERTTTLYVMILGSILQATMSLISLASSARFLWQGSAAIAAAYSVQQRAAWAIAALWSVVAVIAGVAMLRRRIWARSLYAVGGLFALLAWFALLPWPLVITAVVPVAATTAALYSRAAETHWRAVTATAKKPRRALAATTLFAAATGLIYGTYLGMFLSRGWMYEQFGGNPPLYHFIAWIVILVGAVFVSPPGTRAWQCGVSLMVSVVALTFAFIGFLPYTAVFARHLGAQFHPFEINWGPAGFGVTVIAGAAWLLLSIAKMRRGPKEPPSPHGPLPDFT
ncbi:hypothetical protein AB1286_30965 [Trinickia sp. NRRL B-1857]|uniref:hypothetical protein n=1 Tax=Trinickia sp. NRRL B-1857 TaxID=3162879 RepID=UPI003D2B5884